MYTPADIPDYITENISYDGDLWLWTGNYDYAKCALVEVPGAHMQLVHKVLARLIDPTAEYVIPCRHPLCVNPEHLRLIPASTSRKLPQAIIDEIKWMTLNTDRKNHQIGPLFPLNRRQISESTIQKYRKEALHAAHR